MCMTLAFAWGTGGIVATCTRFNLFHKDGSIEPVDAGGKLTRTRNGFAATTGELSTMLVGLRVLEHADGPEARAGIRAIHSRIAPALRSAGLTSDSMKTCFLSVRSEGGRFGAEAIYPDGTGVDWQPVPRVMATWPGKVKGDVLGGILGTRNGRVRSMTDVLGEVQRLDKLVNTIASWFAFAADRDDSMAPTMEIGLLVPGSPAVARYAKGTAAEIAADPAPLQRFGPVPERPPFPHAEAERFFFGTEDAPGAFTLNSTFPTYWLRGAA